MGSFPSLPSGNNPYVGAAAGAAGSAAGIYNDLQRELAQHADRQATQSRQKDQDQRAAEKEQFANEQALLKQGATKIGPADSQSTAATPAAPGMSSGGVRGSVASPTASAGGQPTTGDGTTQYEPIGKNNWYIPSQKELRAKEVDDDPKNFVPAGALNDALVAAGRKPGEKISPTDSHSILQAFNEANAQMDEPYEIDSTGKYKDASGNPTPVMIGRKTGKVVPLDLSGANGANAAALPPAGSPQRGTGPAGMTPIAPGSPGAGMSFSPKEPAEKAPKSLHFEKDTNDAGDVVTRGFDPESGDLKSTRVEKGIGAKRKDPDAGPRDKPPSPAQFRMVVSSKAKALKQANDAYAKAIAPVGGAGGLPVSDEERATALTNLRQAHVQAQNDYEEGIGALTGKDVPHNDWADKALEAAQTPAAAPAQKAPAGPGRAPAKPAQPTAAPAAAPNKKYKASEITDWAKKNGKDPADALKRAKANGLL